MMHRYTCHKCGANLDPGERCDCEDVKAAEQMRQEKQFEDLLIMGSNSRRLVLNFANITRA